MKAESKKKSKRCQALPQDLLMQILARVPILFLLRLRTVCKQWNWAISSLKNSFQALSPAMPLSSTPAFFLERVENEGLEYPTTQVWLIAGNSNIYKLPLDFLPTSVEVVTVCKSLIWCRPLYDSSTLYICNPVTRTWRHLPTPSKPTLGFSVAMAFDSSANGCRLLIGTQNTVEMYDSQTNVWTQSDITANKRLFPFGEGIYSNGRVYWMNNIPFSKVTVAVLDLRMNVWYGLKAPRLPGRDRPSISWYLTGQEGAVILVSEFSSVLWKLNEETNKWTELHNLSKLESAEDEKEQEWDDLRRLSTAVAMNSNGWVSLLEKMKRRMVIYNAEGKLVRTIAGEELKMLIESSTRSPSMRAFEANNIWWP
eukprot:Gb_00419 [translate_table: standard]